MDEGPKIRSRHTTKISPWVDIIAREVEFTTGSQPQLYHSVGQADYLAMLALTPDGQIPLVRQYRPAIEAFTWELPAGLVDGGEEPADGAVRELLEETGYPARKIHRLGSSFPCAGRFSNRIHSFFIETEERAADFQPEAGVTVRLVTPDELVRIIKAGDFSQQLHLGTLMQAELRGLLKLPRDSASLAWPAD
jgi:8-oxo-dGTP pyrophosphatase MutT (NUDIX family)